MEIPSLIFLGSKEIGYHCLDHLIQQQQLLGFRIAGILTNDRSLNNSSFSLRQLAMDHQLPLFNSLDEIPEVDWLYSVQYHAILKTHHLTKSKRLEINLHMAPLPEYRGCNQFSFAISEQRSEFGVSIHEMSPRIDQGDLLFESRFPIPDGCWVEQLYQLTFDASLTLFKLTLSDLLQNRFSRIPQEVLVKERGCSLHYRNEIDALKQIDLSWDKEKIERHIRATDMPGFEPPFAIIDGQKIYLSRTWNKNG